MIDFAQNDCANTQETNILRQSTVKDIPRITRIREGTSTEKENIEILNFQFLANHDEDDDELNFILIPFSGYA